MDEDQKIFFRQPCNCNEILSEILENLKPQIELARAKVTLDSFESVMADPLQLKVLFSTLITNALRFSQKAAPIVHISSGTNGANALFSVSDNGIGIPPKLHESLFESGHELAGVRLVTCKKIVESLGGTIWVVSTAGKGATFYFTLPKA